MPHDTSDIAVHRCGGALRPTSIPATSRVRPQSGISIDVHCHTYCSDVEDLIADHPDKLKGLTSSGGDAELRSAALFNEQLARLMPKITNLDARLQEMDEMGVDIQVISPMPTQYYYWAGRELGDAIAARYNAYIADVCAKVPERLLGFGTVSLQHPDLAAEQLTYAIRELGLRGVEISTLVNGLDLADPMFDPFWAKADELGAVVLLHAWGTTLGERVSKHYLGNIIGQPLETTIALSNLIFGGTFDRFPGLKLIAVHGGGYLPLYSSRSDRGHAVRPEARGCAHKPSEYFRRNIWCDSIVYEPEHLQRLIDAVGADHVVVGTDYPFGMGMGHYDVHPLMARLDAKTRMKVLGANAAKILGLVLERQP